MLEEGRRYFGSAGAGLTHQAYNHRHPQHHKISRGSARIGITAERKTSDMLRTWLETHPNAVLVDSVHIKGFGDTEINEETGVIEGGDTDHVLIIGNHVIIIDTKRWKQKRSYSVSSKGEILRSTGKNRPPRGFTAGRVNILGSLGIWRRYLPDADVFGVICINADKTFVKKDKNWYRQPFRVVTGENLLGFLDSRYEKLPSTEKTVIATDIVAKTVVSAIKPYDGFKAMNLT